MIWTVNKLSQFEAGYLAYLSSLWEAQARKIGNVHPNASFEDSTFSDFHRSAMAIHPVFGINGLGLSGRMLTAVSETNKAVNQNTNLGIILLIGPLTWVPPNNASLPPEGEELSFELRAGLPRVLNELTVEDAINVYEAIRIANPGGLGSTDEQDVAGAPNVNLLEAMQLAAGRDLVARQYANNYADVFDLGVPALLEGYNTFGIVEAAVIHCQLAWMAEFPDSLIARKCGVAVAEDVRERVRTVQQLGGLATAEGRSAGVALDKHLRSDGNKLNPGTTADLVCACLFVALREGKIPLDAPFEWKVEDWL